MTTYRKQSLVARDKQFFIYLLTIKLQLATCIPLAVDWIQSENTNRKCFHIESLKKLQRFPTIAGFHCLPLPYTRNIVDIYIDQIFVTLRLLYLNNYIRVLPRH